MESVQFIGYQQFQQETKLIPNDGYFCQYDYGRLLNHGQIYCCEVQTINRIIENVDGYFDFSKKMIDIGSEIGVYSFTLPFQYAYMFEGNKAKCIIASMNMLVHHKEFNFDCHNVLLSDKIENIKYDGFCTEHTINGGIKMDMENADYISTQTLDSYELNDIGFIKIDVECMEYFVLKGGIETIKRNNYPPILFELWPIGHLGMTQEIHDRLQNFLEDLGYEILWNWGDGETHLAIHK